MDRWIDVKLVLRIDYSNKNKKLLLTCVRKRKVQAIRRQDKNKQEKLKVNE